MVEEICHIGPDHSRTKQTFKTEDVGTAARYPAHRLSALPIQSVSEDFRQSFWDQVQRGAGCWEWQGSMHRTGYGRVRLPGNRAHYRAHRVAFALAYDRDPGPLLVCHQCDNPKCCRPDHLFLGTDADNTADMVAKGRHKQPYSAGAKNGNAKMTEAEARRAIRALMEGKSNKAIAAVAGVSHAMISRIRVGRAWRSLSRAMGYEPKPAPRAPKSGRTQAALTKG